MKYTNEELELFYEMAGSVVAGFDWGTPTNIQHNMMSAQAMLIADDIKPPYDLYLNPAQFTETRAVIQGITVIANEEGIVKPPTYALWIEENILGGGKIVVSKGIMYGTGLLIQLGMTKDGNPDGICKITGI